MVRVQIIACALAGTSLLSLAACQKAANVAANTAGTTANAVAGAAESVAQAPKTLAANATEAEKIASAESAAPAAISRDATIIDMAADGSMKTLRAGNNNWTCLPDAVTTPGPDPMCADKAAMAWIAAWQGHKPPAKGQPGLMYMLEGGTDASNTDPYAQAPTTANNWIKTGPHIMILGSADMLAAYPRDPNPDTSKPYVMWSGTPYEHLMVPIK